MPLKTNLDEQPALNLIPMIDVMLVLTIFFMACTKFSELERSIGLQIPEVADRGALTEAPRPRVVNLYPDVMITLDHKPVTLKELTAQLKAAGHQYSDLAVLERGDRKGELQAVVSVLNACKQAGIHNLGVAVRANSKMEVTYSQVP